MKHERPWNAQHTDMNIIVLFVWNMIVNSTGLCPSRRESKFTRQWKEGKDKPPPPHALPMLPF
eukprot:1191512-Amorphochlora_amoeboformis.AAC.1